MEQKPRIIPLLSAERIAERVSELAAEISEDYAGKNPIMIGILRGAWVFLADLSRAMTIPHHADFVQLSSYGSGTTSSKDVQVLKDIQSGIKARHVILVEDIVDTGYSLSKLINLLKDREPASLAVCSLLDKPQRREVEVHIDYLGFSVPNKFIVGYGLDWDDRFRHLPYVGVLEFEK
ncbi:hypoxanthine phosphoribosyltransferase [bacterium]|nr:hypoxanthine phosphoribosyltransferase [bacterium]